MSAARRLAWVLNLGVALALAASRSMADDASATPAPQPPLTNEDIVRMVAGGTPEAEIRMQIRTRAEAFDLTDEMIDELKLAGVSAAIVAAMVQRHAESAPPAIPEEREARGMVHLVVKIGPPGPGSRTVRAPAWADEDAKARFHLPKETDQRQVKDLAVFLACSTAEHVPELWRSKTPLGRDMSGVVRHQMLAFVAGNTPAGKSPRLQLPAALEADVDDSEPHDLVLGIAARIGDRWIQVGAAVLKQAKIAPGQKPLLGRFDQIGRGLAYKVELSSPR